MLSRLSAAIISLSGILLIGNLTYVQAAGPVTKKTLTVSSTNWQKGIKQAFGKENLESLKNGALRVHYPKGSSTKKYAQENGAPLGGAQFTTNLGLGNMDTMILSYDMQFDPNFNFRVGGKLPGLYGGKLGGGTVADGTNGWIARLVWGKNGKAVLKAFVPSQDGGEGTQDVSKGLNLGAKSGFHFEPGKAYHVVETVKLNTPGKSDGSLSLTINGKPIVSESSLKFRTVNSLKSEGLLFSTFFSGDSPEATAEKDEYTDFKNITLQ